MSSPSVADVTAALTALKAVHADASMISDLEPLVAPLGVASSGSEAVIGKDLANIVSYLKLRLTKGRASPVEDASTTSMLVSLAGGVADVDRLWGAIALIEELTGVGKIAVQGVSGIPSTTGATPSATLFKLSRATLAAVDSATVWDMVVTDVASNPTAPPASTSHIAVLLNATDAAVAAVAAWKSATKWHVHIQSVLIAGV